MTKRTSILLLNILNRGSLEAAAAVAPPEEDGIERWVSHRYESPGQTLGRAIIVKLTGDGALVRLVTPMGLLLNSPMTTSPP